MHDGEGERRWYQVTEWDKQQFLSPSRGPRDGRVPDVVFLHCSRFVHTQRVGGALTPSWQQGTEERAATCTGLCEPVLQTQHAMVYGAFICKGCHLCLNAAGSWCLVRVAASASAALTAAPGLRVQGASWNWTRWTKNKQPTLAPPCVRQPPSYRRECGDSFLYSPSSLYQSYLAYHESYPDFKERPSKERLPGRSLSSSRILLTIKIHPTLMITNFRLVKPNVIIFFPVLPAWSCSAKYSRTARTGKLWHLPALVTPPTLPA